MFETYRFIHRLPVAPPSPSMHWPCDNITRAVAIMAQIKGEGFPDREHMQIHKVSSSCLRLYSQNQICIFIYFFVNYCQYYLWKSIRHKTHLVLCWDESRIVHVFDTSFWQAFLPLVMWRDRRTVMWHLGSIFVFFLPSLTTAKNVFFLLWSIVQRMLT